MARLFFLWTLIVLVPAINIRMICVDHAVEISAAPDCTDMCPRPQRTAGTESTTDCVLVAGGCSIVSAALVWLPAPPVVAFAGPSVKLVTTAPDPDLYLPPSGSPLSPPPKA